MSYTSFEAFEASLEENRIRRSKPSINKKALKNVLHHVESHNRNQEEQEMWKKHFSSKETPSQEPSSEEERGKKRKKKKREKSEHKRKKKRKMCEGSHPSTPTSEASGTDPIGPLIEEFLRPKPQKWGHDGYHELYKNNVNESSSDSEAYMEKEKRAKHKRKKSKKKKAKKAKDWSDEGISFGKRKKS